MQLQALLNSGDWQAIQADWQALLLLTEQPREHVRWDPLRVYIDRHLNALQKLVLNGPLNADEQHMAQNLMQARFDQALEHLNLHRQKHQPYNIDTKSYRGIFSRHQAIVDLETSMLSFQAQLEIQQVPREIRFHILHDDNFELIERYTLLQLPEERPAVWQQALKLLVALSWTEQNSQMAYQSLETAIDHVNLLDLAQRSFKSTRFVQAQCSAIRILNETLDIQALNALFSPLFEYSETPISVLYEMLISQKSPIDQIWSDVLLKLIKQNRSDREQGQGAFGLIRQLALKRLIELPKLANELYEIFQAQSEQWEPKTRLQAIQTLAHHHIYTHFEQVILLLQDAARQDDVTLLQQAVETLVLQANNAAIPFLLAVLNGQYRQETALEKLQKAFAIEYQEQYPFLLLALEKLGRPVERDLLTGKWRSKKM